MSHKKIATYSAIELFDIIKNSSDMTLVEKAHLEFESRKLTAIQKAKIESDYLKSRDLQEKRKQEPLTEEEWLTFFSSLFLLLSGCIQKTLFLQQKWSDFKNTALKQK